MILQNAHSVVINPYDVRQNVSVFIEGNQIVEIASPDTLHVGGDQETIDCTGLILMPGLVNAHNHVYEIVCRGIGRNERVHEWLINTIYPVTQVMTEDDFYHAAVLGASDALSSGTTALVSQLTNFARFNVESEARAFSDCGLRACVARAISTKSRMDATEDRPIVDELETTRAFIERWDDDPLIRPAVGPSGLWACSEDDLRTAKSLATSYNAPFLLHLAETEVRAGQARDLGFRGEVDRAEKLGLLDELSLIAHAVWIDEGEIRILSNSGSTVAHNPGSNMVLASGVANVVGMLEAGVQVSLGTDGPASNDSQDMISEMKLALLLSRVSTLDAGRLTPQHVFAMATSGGAKIFPSAGAPRGNLSVGNIADIVGVRAANNPAIEPLTNPVESLVLCASGRDVELTIVDGLVRYQLGKYFGLDPAASVEFVNKSTMPRVRKALGLAS